MSTAHIDLTDLDGAVTGSASVEYSGQGDAVAVVSSAVCEGLDREGVATFRAAGCGDVSRRVVQEGLREAFTDWDFLCADGGTFHVLKEEYAPDRYTIVGGTVDTVVTVDGVAITVAAGATVSGFVSSSITCAEQTLREVHVRGDVALSLGTEMAATSQLEVLEYHYTGAGRSFSFLTGREGDQYDCVLTTVILSGIATSVECMLGCFANHALTPDTFPEYDALTTIDIAGLDTSQLTSLFCMFACWSGVRAFPVAGLCTSRITSVARMFYWCKSVESLDLSSWDTSRVTSLEYTFNGCSSLTTLRLGSWKLQECANFTNAFSGCWSLSEVSGTITGIDYSLDLSSCPLTRESALVFINGLNTLAAGTTLTLSLSSTTKALLTDADIQIATDKGWTIA